MDLNKVMLIGNVVRDPETVELKRGQNVRRFSLATSLTWLDSETKEKREATDFHDIVAWGRLGDVVGEYVKKGNKVYVEGKLRQRHYEDTEGKKRVKAEITAGSLIMLSPKGAAAAPEAEQVDEKLAPEEPAGMETPQA